jgi:hypothetical protein
MVYNIILVGVFKPLISNSVSAGVSKGTPYDEVVSKAKDGYFELISAMAKFIFATVFKVIHVRLALFLLLVYVPLAIFMLTLTYHLTIARPKNIEKTGNIYEARATNYHYVTIIVISFIILSIGYIVFVGMQNV